LSFPKQGDAIVDHFARPEAPNWGKKTIITRVQKCAAQAIASVLVQRFKRFPLNSVGFTMRSIDVSPDLQFVNIRWALSDKVPQEIGLSRSSVKAAIDEGLKVNSARMRWELGVLLNSKRVPTLLFHFSDAQAIQPELDDLADLKS